MNKLITILTATTMTLGASQMTFADLVEKAKTGVLHPEVGMRADNLEIKKTKLQKAKEDGDGNTSSATTSQ